MDDVTVTDPVASEEPVTEACAATCEATTEAVSDPPVVEDHPPPTEPPAEMSPAEAELAGAT